jgi:hypothetical protein
MKAEFKGERSIRLPNGQVHEVVVFSTKTISFLGQYLLFTDIVVHQVVFQSEALLYFVVAHEASHKSGRWYLAFFGLVGAISGACALIGFLLWVGGAQDTTWRDWMLQQFSFAQRLSAILVLAVIPFLVVWLSEFKADYDAICTIRMTVVRKALKDKKRLVKYSLGSRLFNALQHPPRSITLRIYSLLH